MRHSNRNAAFLRLRPLSDFHLFHSNSNSNLTSATETAELLQETVEELPVPISILDEKGRILAASQLWKDLCQLISLERIHDVKGRDYTSLFCISSKNLLAPTTAIRKLKQLLRLRTRRIQFDYQINNEGHWHHHRLMASRHTVSGKERFAVIHHDITPSVHILEERRAWAARLLDVQLQERQRIARELHDSTAQHLAAISLSLARLPQLEVDPIAGAVFRDIHSVVTEAQREIRAISFLLHPPDLAERGLSLALDRLCAGFSERTGLPIHFESHLKNTEVTADIEIALFRIGQEALTNIHKHAKASTVVVKLYRRAKQVILEIDDDGIGFNPQHDATDGPQFGAGISGMKARLSQFSGQLLILKLERGTRLKAVAPLKARLR